MYLTLKLKYLQNESIIQLVSSNNLCDKKLFKKIKISTKSGYEISCINVNNNYM